MAVYKQAYRGYAGPLTPAWSRFFVLPRHAFARLFESRFLLVSFATCFFYPLGCAAFIYMSHNLSFLKALNIPAGNLLDIDAKFFLYFCNVQGALAYLLTAFVGPSLISPDLSNNALPLYFCRPFSRTEYVTGKMSVLLLLLSSITWICGLILFAIQASLAGWEWTSANLWIAGALFVGLVVWTVVLSLIALAMSSWVKWKIAGGALVLGVFFAGASFGSAINSVMRTKSGSLINLTEVIYTVWSRLFRADSTTGIEVGDAWTVLGVACAICLWLLARRLRAFEVVK